MRLTAAGKQVEDALALGHEVAAFNLYADAIRNDVALVEASDASDAEAEGVTRWHRKTQERIKFNNAPVQDGSILVREIYERDASGAVMPDGETITEYEINTDVD